MNIMELLKFLPFTVFLITARLHGMTDIGWENAFIWGGICTIIVVAVQLDKKVVFDRIMLGVNLFLLIGAIAFVTCAYSILDLYGTYKGASLFTCIGIVGLLTTLYTEAGFVGTNVVGKTRIKRIHSYSLLLLTFLFIIWSFVLHSSYAIVSIVIPFVVLRTMYERFVKELERVNE